VKAVESVSWDRVDQAYGQRQMRTRPMDSRTAVRAALRHPRVAYATISLVCEPTRHWPGSHEGVVRQHVRSRQDLQR
jgi:hypothetical protein